MGQLKEAINLVRTFPWSSMQRVLGHSVVLQRCACVSLLPVRSNSNRSSIAKIGRKVYTRLYPTTVVLSNGATINVRYHEPRRVIQLPLDISTLSEEEQQARLWKRRPKTRVVVEEDVDVDFDASRYVKIGKKAKQ